jgi:glycosyltransferase involved in cell wall biosynthesis
MKKLKILMICSEFPPNCAGIGNSVYCLSKALVKRGHKVTVLTRGGYFQETKRSMDGIEIIELPFIAFPPPLHLIYHGLFLNEIIRNLESSYDVIHLHTPLVPKVRSFLPKIASVHSLWLEETKHFSDSKDLYSLAVRMFKIPVVASEKSTLKQSDKVIVYPENRETLLQMYKSKNSSIKTINGMISSLPISTGNENKKIYDVIFVGRLNPRKGAKELLEAASVVTKKIPSASFLIIGDGISRKWMEMEVQKKNIRRNFTFLGFLPHTKVVTFLNISRISIVPSRYEPFGLVTGEAMASGLPVVGTKVSGTKNLVMNGGTGYLVDVNDYKSLANRLIFLIQNPERASQMGDRGRKRIKKYFSEKIVTDQFVSVYRKLI